MKRLNLLMLSLLFGAGVMVGSSVDVKADSTISGITIKAKNDAGETTDVTISPALSSDVTEYQLGNLPSDTTGLDLTPTTTESGALYHIEWDALEPGDNETYLRVTDSEGNVTNYTFYSHVMTDAEQETYVADDSNNTDDTDNSDSTAGANEKKDVTTVVNGYTMKIVNDFSNDDVPEGFTESTLEYDGSEVKAIKGDVKNLTAVWLEPVGPAEVETTASTEETTSAEEVEAPEAGFYIYRPKKNTFYKMSNVYIKSRMYTIIKNLKPDAFIKEKNYSKTTVTVGDENVEMWILDETNQLYLVYAMNWDGETNLYCYDDVEKCFQRYIFDSSANQLLDSANQSNAELRDEYNALTDKYNSNNKIKWYIIGGLLVVIIILFFVSLNLKLSLSEKRLNEDDNENDYDDSDKYYMSGDSFDNEPVMTKAERRAEKKAEKENAREAKRAAKNSGDDYDDDYYEDDDYEDDDEELFLLVDDKPKADIKQTEDYNPEPVIADSQAADDDFVIVNGNSQSMENTGDFNIAEIDLSEQVKKEMESGILGDSIIAPAGKPHSASESITGNRADKSNTTASTQARPANKPANKPNLQAEKFNTTDVFNTLDSAFPSEKDDDDDGFTFI